MWRK
jgi:hypothetical protein